MLPFSLGVDRASGDMGLFDEGDKLSHIGADKWFNSYDLTEDKTGLVTSKIVWQGRISTLNGFPAVNSPHPDIPALKMERRTFSVVDGLVTATFEYAGALFDGDESEPVYDLANSASEEPIDTHPAFPFDLQDDIYGKTPDLPVIRGTDGVFKGFRATIPPNEWQGVQSYLYPIMTWRKSWTAKYQPTNDVKFVGRIDMNPAGNAPDLGTGPNGEVRNWLCSSFTYQKRGGVYACQQEWRASGPKGWNTKIYSW